MERRQQAAFTLSKAPPEFLRYLHDEFAKVKFGKYLSHNFDAFCVRQQGIVLTGDVKILEKNMKVRKHLSEQLTSSQSQIATTYTLVEFSVSAPRHRRIVSSVNLGNVVALDVGQLVHG